MTLPDYTIEFPEDYAGRRELETPDKGWLDVVVRFSSGRCYSLHFYDPIRLQQTIADALEDDRVFTEPGLVVVDEVNTYTVRATVAVLVLSGVIFAMPT